MFVENQPKFVKNDQNGFDSFEIDQKQPKWFWLIFN